MSSVFDAVIIIKCYENYKSFSAPQRPLHPHPWAMLDPEVPLGTAPRRILHRAGNLLTSNGHVEPTIKHFIDDHSSDSSPTKPPNKLKLSTSIKLKFKEVKDGVLFRSRSLQARSNIGDAENLKRLSHHTRSASVSDVTITTKSPEHPRMSIDSEMYALSTKERLASVPETTKQSKMAYNSRSQTVTETGVGDVTVPQLLQEGTPMTKVSAKQRKRAVFRLDPDIGQIIWESKKHGISMFQYFSFASTKQSYISSNREHQRTTLRPRRALLPRAIPARSRIRRPVAQHHIHSRWAV